MSKKMVLVVFVSSSLLLLILSLLFIAFVGAVPEGIETEENHSTNQDFANVASSCTRQHSFLKGKDEKICVTQATASPAETGNMVFEGAGGVELYYDDGNPERGWYWTLPGGMFAVRFTPPASGQLIECSFYIYDAPDTFMVHVLDANKSDIITPFSRTPSSTGWFHVDLSTYGINASLGVDFYIAMETTVANASHIGADSSNPDGRSWDYDGVSWSQWLGDDYMIRALIETGVVGADLKITNVYLDPVMPMPGENVTFYADVENQGTENATDFEAELYLDEVLLASGTFSLAAGANDTYWNIDPWMATPGNHTVRWAVDTTDLIPESNEDNNEMSDTFTVEAGGVELYYDDGTAEWEYSWGGAGGMYAVRFTPPASGQLIECSFYISSDPDTIMVHVLDANKSDIITPFSRTPSSTGWFHVDLSTYGITVSQDIDFYVAMESTAVYAPWLGADESDPDGRSWDYDGVSWSQWLGDDYMIRAVIEYITQYYLTVDSPYGTPGGEGWYETGTTAYATLDTGIVDHGNGTRRVFTHWSGDASGTNYAQSDPIQMDGPKTAIANWKTQYLVTFAQTGLDNTANSTVVTVNGSAKTFGDFPFDVWVDTGSILTYSYEAIITSTLSGKQYRLDSVIGPTSPITVTTYTTVTGNYITQYLVTFAQTGLDATATGTAVTVNGDTKTLSDLPYTTWIDSGDSISYSYSDTVSSSVEDERFKLVDVAGPTSPITVAGSITITGNYKVQYQVTVKQSGCGTTVTATIDGDSHNLPKSFWFDNGSQHSISVPPTVILDSDTQYVFTQWHDDETTLPRIIVVTSPTEHTAYYKTQYKLTFQQSGSEETLHIILDNETDSPPCSFWFDADSSHSFSYELIVSGDVGIQYVLTSTSHTSPITLVSPTTVSGYYKTQYYLTVGVDPQGIATVSGKGWYDANTEATTGTAQLTITGVDVQYNFETWSVDGTNVSGNPVTITMNSPCTAIATYKTFFASSIPPPSLARERIKIGKTITVSGSIIPTHEGVTVTLTYMRPEGPTLTRTVTSSSDGTFNDVYTPDVSGEWSVTASWLGDLDHLGATSSLTTFKVEPISWQDHLSRPEILGLLIASFSVICTVTAFVATRRKRGRIKSLLNEIDNAYLRFKVNARRCEAELYRLRDIILEDYKNGKITEQSYDILNDRIDDYLKKL